MRFKNRGSLFDMKIISLTCLCNNRPQLLEQENGYLCPSKDCIHSNAKNMYPKINGTPVIISTILTDTVCNIDVNPYIERSNLSYPFLRNLLLNIRKLINIESSVTKKNCEVFVNKLLDLNPKPKILVIGSGEKGSGTDYLWNNKDIEIHGTDIYDSENVNFVADSHYLPIDNNYYDGVWIQAVLEHVIDPSLVVNEIHRVLKKDGIVYAETPFMQQVHEGAYDFTRYTVLGHRYLFKRFGLLDMGGNGGPEIVMIWSIRYFFWSVFRSPKIGRILSAFASIFFRPFKYLISDKSMYDSSSGVFFLGKKSESTITHKELVSLYKGNFK